MASVKAVLLDVDGTLLDSNDAHARAWLEALHGAGKQISLELVRAKIGKGGDKLLMEVAGIDSESEQGQHVNARRSAILRQLYLPDLGPTKGSRELVERLQAMGLRCLPVTSSTKKDLAPLLRLATVADLLPDSVTSDDANESKPAPDLVEAALAKIKVDAREVVMLGDTAYDITAAARAGVWTIALRSGGWSDADLEGALEIYDDPAALLARLEDSAIVRGLPDSPPKAPNE